MSDKEEYEETIINGKKVKIKKVVAVDPIHGLNRAVAK